MRTFLAVCALSLCLPTMVQGKSGQKRFPYKQAGLTRREAAAHLLNRFAFGATGTEIDSVLQIGLESWFEAQLRGDLPEPAALKAALKSMPALQMRLAEMVAAYPNQGMLRRLAEREGVIRRCDSTISRAALRRTLREFARRRGLHPQRELIEQLMAQKLLRALYSRNQLREVLTDFWFNHFNVFLGDNQARPALLSYERDAIRPHVLGKFLDLLTATAKHPAMLLYLDNAFSTAADTVVTTAQMRRPAFARRARARNRRRRGADRRRRRGINENYARELMELHTLGVDGGYTQRDVIEVARAFTGWSVMPPGERGERLRRRIARGRAFGFVTEGMFVFRADNHDAGEKIILGRRFAAGGDLSEGLAVLRLLAEHPATAARIARKLAVRFVADEPPETLVRRLAQVFRDTHGDLREVMRALAYSPEFWRREYVAAKIKTPFEYVVSALRVLQARVQPRRPLFQWMRSMGQPLYAFQAPTGFPDTGRFWTGSGAMLNRMKFAVRLVQGKLPGVQIRRQRLLGTVLRDNPAETLAAIVELVLPGQAPEHLTATIQQALAEEMEAAGDRISPAAARQALALALGGPEFQRR